MEQLTVDLSLSQVGDALRYIYTAKHLLGRGELLDAFLVQLTAEAITSPLIFWSHPRGQSLRFWFW